MRFRPAVLILAFALTVPAFAQKTFTIATAEGKTPGTAEKELERLLAHLNTSADYKFTLKTYPDYEAAYGAFKAKKADFALLGPVKYVEAHNDTGAIPLVAEAPKMQQSMIVVAKSSPIKSVADLKGKKFAFGYEDSTTTHLMPLLLLSKHHLTAADLGKAGFLGAQQEKIVEAVASGSYDAGALATSVYESNKDKVRLLEASEPIPGAAIVAHKDLDPTLFKKLRALFVSYPPPADTSGQRFRKGATEIEDVDYNKVRFLCQVLFKKTYH